MSTEEILNGINHEDHQIAPAVRIAIPQIQSLVDAVVPGMFSGGRLFYIGAGTSGRLGIVDASECPPTYGVPQGMVVGIMAGGDGAIRKAVEFAEDGQYQAWTDLQAHTIGKNDTIIGIAASGRTPYVIGGINKARKEGLITGCITCNLETPLGEASQYPIEVVVGPEFVTGSTRMKSGTAQKLVLNMITTSIMIKLGRVKGNRMVDMQLSNNKLIHRGVQMIVDELGIEESEATKLLRTNGSVRKAIDYYKNA